MRPFVGGVLNTLADVVVIFAASGIREGRAYRTSFM